MSDSKESLLSALHASLQYESEALKSAGSSEFDHEPATPQEFIESAEFLGNSIIPEYWPVVSQDVVEFYKSGKTEGIFCEAIGTGKSYKMAIIAAYEAHKLLCLKKPYKTLGLSSDSKLTIMNMGPSAMQARKVVFSKIKGRVDAAPWFKLLYPYNHKITSELRFPKNIFIVPGNSKETFPIGYDIVFGILDEMSFYVDAEDRPVAEEIYLAMQRRLESRLGKRYPWKLVGGSSPQYEGDFTEAKMDDPNCFTRRRPIWEAKPWQYDEPFVDWTHNGITRKIPESLLPTAIKNPTKFLRDFMAISVTALLPYFTDHTAITAAIDNSLVWQNNGILPDKTVLRPLARSYAFHIDLAKSRDSCGLAIGHKDGNRTVIDFAWRITPTPGKTEVNFAGVRQAILELRARGFKFSVGSYDGWQSVDSIQILTAKGIEVAELSVDRNIGPYDTFLEAINEGRASIPCHPTLIKEMKALELIKGKKVDHPKNGSKDVSDAVAGVFFHLRSVGDTKPQSVIVGAPKRIVKMPAMKGYYERD